MRILIEKSYEHSGGAVTFIHEPSRNIYSGNRASANSLFLGNWASGIWDSRKPVAEIKGFSEVLLTCHAFWHPNLGL